MVPGPYSRLGLINNTHTYTPIFVTRTSMTKLTDHLREIGAILRDQTPFQEGYLVGVADALEHANGEGEEDS